MPMREIYNSLRWFTLVLLTFSSIHLNSQSLACNGGVNISMDEVCEVVLHSRLVLKGPDASADPMDFLITIKDHDGSIPSNISVASDPGGPFVAGNTGEYLKFENPGSYSVSVQRKSDGTTCWGDLLIEDKLPPFTRDCPCASGLSPTPEECIFSCATVPSFLNSDVISGDANLNPSFQDNCGDVFSVTFRDELVEGDSCGDWMITRTWSSLIPDANGRMVSKDLNCTQKFLFKRVGLSTIMPPKNLVIVSCGIDTDPESLRNHFSDTSIYVNPNLDSALRVAYPTIADTLASGIINFRQIGAGLTGGTNDDFCKITGTYTDTPIIPDCENIGYKFVRTWHILDWCSKDALPPITQIIKVKDTVAPKFEIQDTIGSSSTNPWTCDSEFVVPAPDTLYDNCAAINQIMWSASIGSGTDRIEANASNGYRLVGVSPGTYTVTYSVADVCGNEASKSAILVIRDEVAPVALSKYRIKVTFSSFEGECVAKIFPHNINTNSYDACDDDLELEIRRLDVGTFGSFVKFDSGDLDDVTPTGTAFGEVMVELRVTDDSGNSSLAWTTVIVEDKNTDVIIDCGDDVLNFDCSVDVDSVIAQYSPTVIFDGCEERALPVSHEIRNSDLHPGCNTGSVIVDYFLEGSRDTICTKEINLGDPDGISIVWPSGEITVNCADTDFGEVQIIGGACNNAAPTEEIREFILPDGAGYCKKLIRNITVIDWCSYQPNTGDTTGVYRFVQTIKVIDNDRPTITCSPVELEAGDNCQLENMSFEAIGTDIGICGGELEWLASVDVNNAGTFELEAAIIVVTDSLATAQFPSGLPVGQHTIRWRAIDECGNSDEAFCTITITDTKAPTPQCITNVSTATMNNNGNATIWAADFDPDSNSTDNCGGTVTYSFSADSPNVPAMDFTCADLPDGVSAEIPLMVYVWDESGNRDFCNVVLRIDDNSNACVDTGTTASFVIAGTVANVYGDEIESVSISSQMTHEINDQITGVNGSFSFDENVAMSDGKISAVKNDDYLNGVSTLDLILIQRHILSMSTFDQYHQYVAADVTGDMKVSALDLVAMRRLILGLTADFPIQQSWKFVDANHEIVHPSRPWPLKEVILIDDIQADMMHQDFTAIKIGDLNGNAIANSAIVGGNRSVSTLPVTVANQEFKKGELVSFSLDLNAIKSMNGLEFELYIEGGVWEDLEASQLNVSDDMMVIEDGKLQVSWNTSVSPYKAGELKVRFTALQDGSLAQHLSLGGLNGKAAEAYYGDVLEIAALDLVVENGIDVPFVVHQNIPNPFNGTTTIPFEIGKSGDVEVAIFDITGKQFFGQTKHYKAGKHQIRIDESMISQTGVLYYQISHDDRIVTKKMVALD